MTTAENVDTVDVLFQGILHVGKSHSPCPLFPQLVSCSTASTESCNTTVHTCSCQEEHNRVSTGSRCLVFDQ